MTSIFRAGGLASGLDTNAIIDQLVKIESMPIDLLRQKQAALKSQVSIIGDIASKLSALGAAAKALGDQGVLSVKATSANTAFSATASADALGGRYAVRVDALASAAKARSQAFTSNDALVRAGTLHLDLSGTGYDIAINEGDTLAGVANSINRSGAGVSAAIISDGTSSYLSVTNVDTGFAIGAAADSALTFSEASTGGTGQALGLAIISPATNARLEVDGLAIEQKSNDIVGVIPGVTMSLKATSATAETLVLGNDAEGTAANVQKFVDSYNEVNKVIQRQLSVDENSKRSSTLAGDGAIRGLQQSLQRLISAEVGGLANVRSLADLGIETARDGSLSVDSAVLGKALARAPGALNALFAQDTTGIADRTQGLVSNYTHSLDGILTARKEGLNKNVTRLDDDALRMQARVDSFRDRLIRQYTAMEKIVSGFSAIGNFLSQASTFPKISSDS